MAQRHCKHRWILGEPKLGTVQGTCRRCGAHRSYPSVFEFPVAIPTYEEVDRGTLLLLVESAARRQAAEV